MKEVEIDVVPFSYTQNHHNQFLSSGPPLDKIGYEPHDLVYISG